MDKVSNNEYQENLRNAQMQILSDRIKKTKENILNVHS